MPTMGAYRHYNTIATYQEGLLFLNVMFHHARHYMSRTSEITAKMTAAVVRIVHVTGCTNGTAAVDCVFLLCCNSEQPSGLTSPPMV